MGLKLKNPSIFIQEPAILGAGGTDLAKILNHEAVLTVLSSSESEAKSLKEIAMALGMEIATYADWIRHGHIPQGQSQPPERGIYEVKAAGVPCWRGTLRSWKEHNAYSGDFAQTYIS